MVALGLLVGGCVLSAYQIASWTATGVSYVFSGKGLGDHALSLALNQDCATWRVIKGEEICVDYGGDFENSWEAMASTWKLPEAGPATDINLAAGGPDDPVESSAPVLTLVAAKDETAPFATPVLALQSPIVETTKRKPIRALDFDGLVVPEWAVGPRPESPWQKSAYASRSLDLDGLVVAKRPIPKESVTAVIKDSDSRAAIYLVMGSFREEKNAKRFGAEHAEFVTTISEVARNGRPMFRLLAGPIEKGKLTSTRVDLAKAGIRNSWAVRLCRTSLTIPPCNTSVQQAALP